jgi:hypothetical protein
MPVGVVTLITISDTGRITHGGIGLGYPGFSRDGVIRPDNGSIPDCPVSPAAMPVVTVLV